ncbi:hypothetical protein, partial [Nostoc sp. CHAB 5715]|uniref:hypothetical protein n=1 Tax=Nostoc sp. CHAB 5715 TaxID=2780400 RepID=UPI001E331874
NTTNLLLFTEEEFRSQNPAWILCDWMENRGLEQAILQQFSCILTTSVVGVKRIAHTCQLNVKAMSRKELQFLAHSKSHLKMTSSLSKFLVYFSRLELLALEFIPRRVRKLTDKRFLA